MAVQGPVIPRRRIGDTLRRLRAESGRTLEDVATELMISTSKLSRLENGQGSPQPRDVRDLIRLYKIEGTQIAERLNRWVRASHRQGWWEDHSRAITEELGTHLAYEAEAHIARVYTIPVLPVLLQTADYAREFYRSAETWWSAEEVEQLVEIRQKRQAMLDQRDGQPPLELIAVTHESSIRQLVGSAEIMRAQLDHLIERSTNANVELRVFPFSATPRFTSTCMYAYLEFTDELDRDVVQIETHAGFRNLEVPNQVKKYRGYHEALRQHSLSPEDTRALIRSVRDEQFS